MVILYVLACVLAVVVVQLLATYIYYNIIQNVQKTQIYLLTTTLPLHTDTYLQKYPNFVLQTSLKPRTTKSQKIFTKKAGK